MAVFKPIMSKGRNINSIIDYVTKKEKTEKELISGKDCIPITAKLEMKTVKEQFDKTDGREYMHYTQSFKGDEATPEKAHQIAKEFAEKNFKGYQVLIATHTDKKNIHSHFIVNSVNFENGYKYQQSKKDIEKLRQQSDKICEREGLSVITDRSKEVTSSNSRKYRVLEKAFNGEGKSYLLDTAKTVNESLKGAKSKEEFKKNMESKGYQVEDWKDKRKYLTFTTPEGKKVRSTNLEKTFKEEVFKKENMEKIFKKNDSQEVKMERIEKIKSNDKEVQKQEPEIENKEMKNTKGKELEVVKNEVKRENRNSGSGRNSKGIGAEERESKQVARTEHESENGIRKHTTKREFRTIEERIRTVEQGVNGNNRNNGDKNKSDRDIKQHTKESSERENEQVKRNARKREQDLER